MTSKRNKVRINTDLLERGYATIADVSRAAQKHISTIHRWCKTAQLSYVKDGTLLYIDLDSLQELYEKDAPVLVPTVLALREQMKVKCAELKVKYANANASVEGKA